MRNKFVRELVLSALFVAAGLVLPSVFHLVNNGKVFLPMHIPVLLAGFSLSMPFAAAVGAITPLLSSLLTGMPPLFPIMVYMIFELSVYAVVASMFYRKFKMNVYISLICSMISGRVAAALAVWVLVALFSADLPGPIAFIIGTITGSIPGIAIQLVFIPPVVMILEKNNILKREGNTIGSQKLF